MVIVFSLIGLIVITQFLFLRYFPIYGLHDIDRNEIGLTNNIPIDIRDYNEAYKDPINPGINIPIAYLKRFYSEIPNSELVVVASNGLERNVGVRILRRKGFKVVGYSIPSHKKKIVKEKQINSQNLGGQNIEYR